MSIVRKMKRYSKMMSKTKKYVNVTYVIVLKTSIIITISFKYVVIIYKAEFIIVIVDIAISGKDIYLYNHIIFLCLFRFCAIFIIIRFFIFSQLRWIFYLTNITLLLYSTMREQLIQKNWLFIFSLWK